MIDFQEVFLKKYLEDERFRKLFDLNWKNDYFDSTEEEIVFRLIHGFISKENIIPKQGDLEFEISSKSKYEKNREPLLEKVEKVFTQDITNFTNDVIESQFIDILKKKKLQDMVKGIVDDVSKSGIINDESIRSSVERSLEVKGLEKEKNSNIQSFYDVVNKEYPPMNWIVKDILPEGLTLLIGRPKVGKSLLSMDIMFSVVTGSNIFGKEVSKGKVICCYLEDNGRRLKERTERIFGNTNIEDLKNIVSVQSMSTLDNGGLKMIEDLLRDNPGTKLVIIDTLGRVKPSNHRNNDSYLEDVKLLSPVQELSHKYHCCILFIHHPNKLNHQDIMDSINGTTGIGGGADTLLFLGKKERLDNQGKLIVISRETDSKELTLDFDKDKLRWVCLGDSMLVSSNETKQEILDLLKDGKSRTSKTISVELGRNYETIRKRIRELERDGMVVRDYKKKEKYCLPETYEMEVRIDEDLKELTGGKN